MATQRTQAPAKKGSSQSSGKSSGRRIPQRHGGALVPGAGGGVQPGAGRPPSIIREHLRGAFADRIPVLQAIADGAVIQRTKVRVADLTDHVVCANCGERQVKLDGKLPDALYIEIDAMVSAAPKDRIAAIDQMGKYGLGQLKEISAESVREKMKETLTRIQHLTTPDQFTSIVEAIRPLWSAGGGASGG